MVKAVGSTVILVAKKKEKKTESGIILQENQENESNQGVVVAIGPQVQIDIKVGDHVMFQAETGRKPESWMEDGVRHAVLKEVEIIAVFEE